MTNDFSEFKGVRFDDKTISNIQDGKKYRIIHKESIHEIILKFGFSAHFPVIQSIVGIVILLPGFYAIKTVYDWLMNEKEMSRTIIWLSFNFIIGLGVFIDALKKRFFLKIIMKNKNDKIVFNKVKINSELFDFINLAIKKYGYSIDTKEFF